MKKKTKDEMIARVHQWMASEDEAYEMGCLISAEFTPGPDYEEINGEIEENGFTPEEIWEDIRATDHENSRIEEEYTAAVYNYLNKANALLRRFMPLADEAEEKRIKAIQKLLEKDLVHG